MHMMVAKPEQWVKPMAVAGANQYTFHLEATDNPGALIKDIRENGMKVRSWCGKSRVRIAVAASCLALKDPDQWFSKCLYW